MSRAVIELRGICKAFSGNRVLNDIDLTINSAEILCLCGENGSGKSTLIKIISGVYTFDAGEMRINNRKYQRLSAPQSIEEGIQVIYQDLSVFPNLTVAENIAISYCVQKKKNWIDYRFNRELAEGALNKIGVSLDLNAEVEQLSVAEKQIVAISRAIVHDARLIIMDEPTTAITNKEIQKLFEIIRGLKEQGVAVMFVSHKLEEVLEICDRIAIIRNGSMVLDKPVEEFHREKLAFYMTGKEIVEGHFHYEETDEQPLLKVEHASLDGKFEDVSLSVKPGEIVAITGQLGSGRTELAKALFGLNPITSGKIYINGEEKAIRNRNDALRNNIAYLPEDRLTEGLFLNRSIGDNLSSAIVDKLKNKLGIISEKTVESLSKHWMKELNISTKSYTTPAGDFSGGNQQRIVLGKWLANNPKIFILNCPTVGVDVKSKSEIHQIIKQLARDGLAILLISDDLGEILTTSNRVIIMNSGRVVFQEETSKVTAEEIYEKIISSEQ